MFELKPEGEGKPVGFVEQQANPALPGKPIAVIGSNGGTVITTVSYEARKFGVKTAW